MTLSDQKKRNYHRNVLRKGNSFAEEGKFERRGDNRKCKPLRATVKDRQESNEDQATRDHNQFIEVCFSRDESFEGGGVRVLKHGDKFFRDPEFDCDDRPFTFTGVIIEQRQYYTKAEFKRHDKVSQGRGR